MTTRLIIIICAWIALAPAGYLASRWSNRLVGCRWTKMDRLFCLIFCPIAGPFMLIGTSLFALIHMLEESKWGHEEAKW
jgi:hypothetical protein